MSSFMKVDVSIPSDLLSVDKPLPVEVCGVGQLCRPYDTWALAVCSAEHLPQRKTPGAAGHDLYSIQDAVVPAGSSTVIDTGLCVQLPDSHYGKIEGRSSLGILHSVIPFGGIIDQDYRGKIKVKLFNLGNEDYLVKANDRIAQLIIQKYSSPSFKLVSSLESSARGTQGFGSTGR